MTSKKVNSVAMYTIFYNFKTALYSSAVVMKGFNISRMLF